MEKQEIIKNIAARSGGDIYLGVVGAVRTGKSTFIKKMVETLVVPNIEDEYERKRALDEIPQSAAGKTIMTTEPKFVPNNAAKIQIDDFSCNIRLIDCVGYVIDKAVGADDENGPRMVKTPWYNEEIPFVEAAEVGTEKVIKEHSTIGVMQDGFIFSESIAQNIAVGEEQIDIERLRHAVTVANIRDFIDSLPLDYNTKIGMEGNGISQGQRQRILIARAVYKNPEFLFFDEATNALDANNEKEIMEHLHEFYKGKTVVVVAHRLSTVKDADKIVVLDKGRIMEEGTHQELTEKRGLYYELVKNQLELGQ